MTVFVEAPRGADHENRKWDPTSLSEGPANPLAWANQSIIITAVGLAPNRWFGPAPWQMTSVNERSMTIDLEEFQHNGYLILDVLAPVVLARWRAAADAVMRQPRFAAKPQFHYIPLLLPGNQDATLLDALDHPLLIDSVSRILGGGPLLLDNAALLAAEPGVGYHQGWHRDVLQVPVDHITDAMFSPQWRHNNVQLNLALADDDAFWAVPASHQRPNTKGEEQAFGGSRHLAPESAVMPGGRRLHLLAGQAALYHNNMIHRGYCDFTQPRRTLHIGYHSRQRPPTWHFYNFDDRALPAEHLASLPPGARRWMEDRLARRRQFPDVAPSYRGGFD